MKMKHHFSGWATQANVKCADGRIIDPDAFKHMDGKKVPIIYNHMHDDPSAVLGHAFLEHRSGKGVYAFGVFNDTENGKHARKMVKNGDVRALSIYAKGVRQRQDVVIHGDIVEVSLVLAGANPGAVIDEFGHSYDDTGDTFEILYYTPEQDFMHSEESPKASEEKQPSDDETGAEKTIEEVLDTMTEEQLEAVQALLAMVTEDDDTDTKPEATPEKKDKEEKEVKHSNIFEQKPSEDSNKIVLIHSLFQSALSTASTKGTSFKEELMHALDEKNFGIMDIELAMTDFKNLDKEPKLYGRNDQWVTTLLNSIQKTPFSKVRNLFGNIDGDEARARGYLKSGFKKEAVYRFLKRETTAKTMYAKQKIDRDDVLEITSFDAVAWLWNMMRIKFQEELARAILIGDGRSIEDPDKIHENNIRPIAKDADFFTVKTRRRIATADFNADAAKNFIDWVKRTRGALYGSETPTMFIRKSVYDTLFIIKDQNGRYIYRTDADLCAEFRVGEIVPVAALEGATDTANSREHEILAVMVQMSKYVLGSPGGAQVATFDKFDIDHNQHKLLLEGRYAGALTDFHSAIVYLGLVGQDPTADNFNNETMDRPAGAPGFGTEKDTIAAIANKNKGDSGDEDSSH